MTDFGLLEGGCSAFDAARDASLMSMSTRLMINEDKMRRFWSERGRVGMW
jgi:hypothetical protein